MPVPVWTPALPLADLPRGGLKTFKHGGHQLVIARTAAGEVYALDNRCPHEGYPLAQGNLKECALTCAWHNWKFDVRDGACTLGGEAVRSYPARVSDGTVEVDLAQPDPEQFFPIWLASLMQGIERYDNGRAVRDGVRLLDAGYDPHRLLADVALYDARHAEYGTTHVLALAADAGRMFDRRPGAEAMYAIAPVIDLCGETNQRRPFRERPAPIRGGSLAELRKAVEDEESERAEGLLLGAFEDGASRETVAEWLFSVLSDHYLDFGHRLIYLMKCGELLDRLSPELAAEYAPELYGSLVYSIVLATREDTLPYMQPYARRLAEVESEFPAVHARARDDATLDAPALRAALLDGKSGEAFGAVWDALRAGVPARRVAEELVIVGAHRMLRFDERIDARQDVAETWLWVTHRFTFASAMRKALVRWDSPDSLRMLFLGVMSLHSAAPMDAPLERRPSLESEPGEASDVIVAIATRQPQKAVALTLGLAKDEARLATLKQELEDLLLADPVVRPIVLTHAIKNILAGFDEHAALVDHPERDLVLAANVRFLASPIVERRVHETVGTSIAWVVDGKVPKKLTQ